MKRFGLLLCLALGATAASAQDILTFKDSHVEKVKVLNVTPLGVTYREYDDPNGHECYVNRSNLLFVKLENGKTIKMSDSKGGNYKYYGKRPERENFGQCDFYIQNGWGIGYMFRKQLNKYAGWNLFGASFMSGWNNPREYGVANIRTMGFRLNTPDFEGVKLFAEVTPGYSVIYRNRLTAYNWKNVMREHCFGLDFSTGFQINNRVAIGYNLNYMTNSYYSETSHWGRISYLF